MSEAPGQQSSGDQSPNIRTDSGNVSITYSSNKDALLKAIPEYFDELFRLLARPRRFFSESAYSESALFSRGLIFLCISCALGFLLRMPIVGARSGDWGQVLTATVFYLMTGLILSLVVFFSCRLLGGKGSLRSHVGTFCYIVGVIVVLSALVSLAAQLVMLMTVDEHFALYQEYMRLFFANDEAYKEIRFAPVTEGWMLKASMGLLLGGSLLIFFWLMVAWRALGDLNQFSAGKVSLSLVLFLIMGYWVNKAMVALQSQMGIGPF